MASVAETLTNLVSGSLTDGVAKIISLFKVDPNKALENSTELAKIQIEIQQKVLDAATQAAQMQADINKADANSQHFIQYGWRPSIGWICAAALGSQFIVRPFATWIAAMCGHAIAYPELDTSMLLTLLFGMLGIGVHEQMTKDKS
jgi:hypothetical protein